MKKTLLLLLLMIPLFAHAHGIILEDHSQIKRLSSFRILDAIDLRTEKDFNAPVNYTTINHEGGTKVRVLEILKRDVQEGKKGRWFYVILIQPMWVESGEWLEAYQNFLIFLPDDTPLFDFEE